MRPPVHWHKDNEDKLLAQIAEYYVQNKENLSSFKYSDACKPSGYVLNKKKSKVLQGRIKRLTEKKKWSRMQRDMEELRHRLTQMTKERDTLTDVLQKQSHRHSVEEAEAQTRHEQVVKDNNRLRSELRTNKRLKTLAQNKLKEMRQENDEQREQLDKMKSELDNVKSDTKTIMLYRKEIAQIGALRRRLDRLGQR